MARKAAKRPPRPPAGKPAPPASAERQPRAWPADKIERRPIASLKPYLANARLHSPEQIEQLANSIRQWGWTMPVLVDEQGVLIAGHARTRAAALLNLPDIPVMVARGWSPEQIRAYVIADNKLAMNADWSQELLIKEVGELAASSFDVTLLGFGEAELVHLLEPDRDFDPNREWGGMPAFSQDDLMAWRSIVVHFKDQSGVDDFANRMGQSVTDKTKYLWHPAEPRVAQANQRWKVDDQPAPPDLHREQGPSGQPVDSQSAGTDAGAVSDHRRAAGIRPIRRRNRPGQDTGTRSGISA
jgi:hypothetical protein